MCFALQAVSSVGGLAFFLASLHPFTRGVSATFVRSFLTPTVRTAPAAGRGNAIPGYGEGLGGAHRGAALRQALESSTGDRYASAEFLAHTSDIWNWPSWLVEWGNEALRWQLARVPARRYGTAACPNHRARLKVRPAFVAVSCSL